MFYLEAPKSGFVASVSVTDGSAVRENQTLLKMDDAEEQLRILQLQVMRRTLDIAEARLSASRIDLIDEVASLRTEAARVNQEYRNQSLRYNHDRHTVGEIGDSELAVAETALLVSNFEVMKTEIESQRLVSSIDALKTYLESYKKLIGAEIALLEKRIAASVVASPASGQLRWYIFSGGYALAGTIIATVSAQ